MIDLHTHTDESDGTWPPSRLVQEAVSLGLEALAISDHDTFAGYDRAVPDARESGLDLVCGIEFSTKFRNKTVHLLGYFLEQPPSEDLRAWLDSIQKSRVDRNRRLTERLRALGLDIRLEEAQAKGRSLTGRPHFAALLIEKGYVSSVPEAFEQYLGESAQAYVDRLEPSVQEAIERIRASGGLPSLAHPVRPALANLEEALAEMCTHGLGGIEVYHSDHSPQDIERFLTLAHHFDLAVTGGSDFHGDAKPGILLGRGRNNIDLPKSVLDDLRAR